MSSLDKQIIQVISKVKRRMHIGYTANLTIVFMSVALLAGVILSIVSRFIPIYNTYTLAELFVTVSVMLGISTGLYISPEFKKAALRADSLGLLERAVTAVELIGDESPIATLQKKDALEHLRKLDYRKKISVLPHRKHLIVCLVLALALITTGFLPNPMAQKAKELYELNQKKAQEIKKVEKAIEKVNSDPKLTKEQKKELETKLSDIKKEIKLSLDKNELNKSLQRSEKKMELLKQQSEDSKKSFDKMIDTLSKFDSLKNIANLMKAGDSKPLKESLKNLDKALKSLSKEQLEELSKSISKLADDIKNNPELKNALKQAANKLAQDGELSPSDLGSLSDTISDLMENEDFRNAVSELSKELGKLDSNQGMQGSGQDGQGQGSGGLSGQSGQSGQGGQQGQNGQGQGTGSGAGNGTDKGSENQTPTSPQSSGLSSKDSSQKKVGEYEKVFTPKTLGGDGQQSQLKGRQNKGGSTEITNSDKSMTQRGDSVPYNQVFGEYKDQAFENIDSSNIPEGMKEIVKDYFTSLNE